MSFTAVNRSQWPPVKFFLGGRRGSRLLAAPGARPQLAEGAPLDLPHPLPAQPEPRADLAQRLLGAVEPVARPQDRALALVEAAQERTHLLDLALVQQLLVRLPGQRVGDQLAEHAELARLTVECLLHRARGTVERDQLLDLRRRHPAALRELSLRRLAAVLGQVRVVSPLDLGQVAQRAV